MAWQLQDVNVGGQRDGGDICIPGSHRASLSLPHSDYVASWMAEGARLRSFELTFLLLISRRLTCFGWATCTDGRARPPPDGFAAEPGPLADSGHLVRLSMRAGDV